MSEFNIFFLVFKVMLQRYGTKSSAHRTGLYLISLKAIFMHTYGMKPESKH